MSKTRSSFIRRLSLDEVLAELPDADERASVRVHLKIARAYREQLFIVLGQKKERKPDGSLCPPELLTGQRTRDRAEIAARAWSTLRYTEVVQIVD